MNKRKIITYSLLAFDILLIVLIALLAFAVNRVMLPEGSVTRAIRKLTAQTQDAVDVDTYLTSDDTVSVILEDGLCFFNGPGTEEALIFYPGAKVEYTAYAPLMRRLAEEGMDCFLVEMPLNLAFLGTNRAEHIMDVFSYDRWYLAGHSLGAVTAALYAAKTDYDIDGLYMLAGYPCKAVKDIPDVLFILGELDSVVNRDKMEASRKYIQGDCREYTIPGGNHSQFGSYGLQIGDTEAEISMEEQIEQTVAQILQK